MAIVIPSKKIYNLKNDIIRNNAINLIDIDAKQSNHSLNSKQTVYRTSVLVKGKQRDPNPKEEYKYASLSGDGSYTQAYAYADTTIQYATFYVYIPRSSKGKYIDKIYDGTDDEGNPQINISNVVGDKTVYKATTQVTFSEMGTLTPQYSKSEIVFSFEEQNVNISQNYIKENVIAEVSVSNANVTASASSLQTIANQIPIKSAIQGERFVLEIKVAVGYTKTTISGSSASANRESTFVAKGKKEEFTAKTLDISIDGDCYEFSLEDVKYQVGDDAKPSALSISSNELMQVENYYSSFGETKNQLDKAFETTIQKFQNGKETATVLCSIGDYYNDEGALAITTNVLVPDLNGIVLDISSETHAEINKALPFDLYVKLEFISATLGIYTEETVIQKGLTYTDRFAADDEAITSAKIIGTGEYILPMCFVVSDIVTPMVYGDDGQDRPVSLKQDGTPKTFQVVGTRVFYDGAVWQELSLQEV